MNVNHVHEEDENHFHKCSHPSCNVTKERLKKYCLLRSKENKVLEKYEKAAKLHDTISKRRQSIAVCHLFPPPGSNAQYLQVNNGYESPRQRRFSTPNKPRPRSMLSNRSISPKSLDTLDESISDEELQFVRQTSPKFLPTRKVSMTPTPRGSSPVIARKLSRSLTNLQHINVDELNNSLQILHDEADFYLERSRKLSTLHQIGEMEKQPYWQRSLMHENGENENQIYGKRSSIAYTVEKENNFNRQRSATCEAMKKDRHVYRERSSSTYEKGEMENQPYWQLRCLDTYNSSEELDHYEHSRFPFLHRSDTFEENLKIKQETHRREWIPTAQHLEAKKRLENRKNLMNKLDVDIHKVNKILRNIKCKSMPILSTKEFDPLKMNDEFQRSAIIETFF